MTQSTSASHALPPRGEVSNPPQEHTAPQAYAGHSGMLMNTEFVDMNGAILINIQYEYKHIRIDL